MYRQIFMTAGIALLLAACQEQRTVVLEQASSSTLAANGVAVPSYQPAPRPSYVPSPCTAPANTGPFERLPHPVSGTTVPMPPRAMAEHVSGCAGVRFRLDADGRPRDIVVMAEYPVGYGFGQTASSAIEGARWPAKDDAAWRYLVINMHPRPPAS